MLSLKWISFAIDLLIRWGQTFALSCYLSAKCKKLLQLCKYWIKSCGREGQRQCVRERWKSMKPHWRDEISWDALSQAYHVIGDTNKQVHKVTKLNLSIQLFYVCRCVSSFAWFSLTRLSFMQSHNLGILPYE